MLQDMEGILTAKIYINPSVGKLTLKITVNISVGILTSKILVVACDKI